MPIVNVNRVVRLAALCSILIVGAVAAGAQDLQSQDLRSQESPSQESPSTDQTAQQLGIAPDQIEQFRNQIAAQGALTADQMAKACSEIGAGHLTADQVDSIGTSVNLPSEQLDQLKQCTAPPTELTQGEDEIQQTQQLQRLCAQAAAEHMTTDEIDSMTASLGFTPAQKRRLKQCSGGRAIAFANPSPAPAISRGPGSKPTPSSIESGFRQFAYPGSVPLNPIPSELSQFGYSLFSGPVLTFAPVSNVPVSGDYVLGPGDEVNVLLWGRVNQTLHLQVQRDGALLMPQTGPLQVGGLTFAEVKNLVEGRIGEITGVHVDVTMGQLRTIQVFVIGQVKQPGLYTVSALSHVSNALVAAGGISKVGSLRRIELRRQNQVAHVIDLYDLLLRGNAKDDVQLEPRDVIFVPVVGAVVAIAGDVKNPAIYEIKGGESLSSALKLAGGVSAFGYGPRLQVERIENRQRRVALDIDLAELEAHRSEVRDGDLIEVFAVLPDQRNVVTLRGNVRRPGSYQWRPGMRVADLLHEGEGVKESTFLGHALIRRLSGPTHNVRYLPVDLDAVLTDQWNTEANLALDARDELTVYKDTEFGDLATVTVKGAVRKPGTYRFSPGMRVSDLVFEAGGLKANAYLKSGELARTEVVNGESAAHFVFMDLNLRAVLNHEPDDDLRLERGDVVLVHEASNWHAPLEVTLEGEVFRPGPYAIHEGERLSSVLNRAGGLRSDAYLPAMVFIRPSVRKLEQQRLAESRRRLQEAVARASLAPPRGSQTEGDKSAALALMQQVLSDTQSQQAVGRIVLSLSSLDQLARTPDDLVLEGDDRIIIPKRPASVMVLGQVYNPTAIVYQPALTVRDYLESAGGATEGADSEHIFVVKANGSIWTDQGLRNSSKGAIFPLLPVISGGLMAMRLAPGDSVFVPEQLIVVDKLDVVKDITQIIVNSATSLAMVGILATNL